MRDTAKRQFRLVEHGLRKFTVCGRCNLQFESKRLNPYEAQKEIQEKLDGHYCKLKETSQTKDSSSLL
jgi:hypothetical protein